MRGNWISYPNISKNSSVKKLNFSFKIFKEFECSGSFGKQACFVNYGTKTVASILDGSIQRLKWLVLLILILILILDLMQTFQMTKIAIFFRKLFLLTFLKCFCWFIFFYFAYLLLISATTNNYGDCLDISSSCEGENFTTFF